LLSIFAQTPIAYATKICPYILKDPNNSVFTMDCKPTKKSRRVVVDKATVDIFKRKLMFY